MVKARQRIIRYLTNKCPIKNFLSTLFTKKMPRIPRSKIVENEEIYTIKTFKEIKFDEIFFRDTLKSPESECVFLARGSLIKK
jgi:hypothetical protein